MRMIFATILIAAALSRAAIDWQATIGHGYAYRFGTLGDLVGGRWPQGLAGVVDALRGERGPVGVGFGWGLRSCRCRWRRSSPRARRPSGSAARGCAPGPCW